MAAGGCLSAELLLPALAGKVLLPALGMVPGPCLSGPSASALPKLSAHCTLSMDQVLIVQGVDV